MSAIRPTSLFRAATTNLILVGLSLIFGTPASARNGGAHVSVTLLSSTDEPRPGQTFLVGFRMIPEAGWHTYWSNPGESGFPTSVKWQAPAGIQIGTLMHPAPTILNVSGMTSYVHGGEHVLLSRVHVSSTLKPGTSLPIEARLSWAACSASLCVPQNAVFKLRLSVGKGLPNAGTRLLKVAESRLPRSLTQGHFAVQEDSLRLRLPTIVNIDPTRVTFFPDENEVFLASPVRTHVANGTTEIIVRRSGRTFPRRVSGVLSDGRNAFRLSFRRGT